MNEKRVRRGIRTVFSEGHQPTDAELHEHWLGVARRDGHRNYHRLISYIDERRENEERWTAALERTDRPLRSSGAMPTPSRAST